MPHESPIATLQDYCAAVRRFSDAIDRVLVEGRSLERRYEQFCAQHGLQIGEGVERLTGPAVEPEQRRIHRALLELSERAYSALLPPFSGRAASSTPAAAAARALSSRNRI